MRRILPKPREAIRGYRSEDPGGDDEAVQGKGQQDENRIGEDIGRGQNDDRLLRRREKDAFDQLPLSFLRVLPNYQWMKLFLSALSN